MNKKTQENNVFNNEKRGFKTNKNDD